MAEEKYAAFGFAGAEVKFKDVAEVFLFVTLGSASEELGVVGGEIHAGVYCGFIIGGGLGEDQLFGEVEELGLLAAGSGEEGSHGDCLGFVRQCLGHSVNFAYSSRVCLRLPYKVPVYKVNTAQGVANLPQPNFVESRLV
jgi:hypothetical protein